MTKRIIAIGASSSRKSINKTFANYAAHQVTNAEVILLDLNDYEMPIYSIDRERENGVPQLALDFKAHIKAADGIVISFAEHNGAYTVAFKNVMDWASRAEGSAWEHKPMLLTATSPGGRGGITALNIAVNKFKFMNNNTISSFSLPFFGTNFSEEEGIIDTNLAIKFREQLAIFEKAMSMENVVI